MLQFQDAELELFARRTRTVQPEVIPLGDGTAKKGSYAWTSSDEGVAKVNNAGTITAVAEGRAVITCAVKDDPDTYALLFVHVVEPVARMTLTPGAKELFLDASAPGMDMTDVSVAFEPANAAYQEVVWSSSNENIASVDQDGHVTAHKPGTVTIRAASTEPTKEPKKASCQITVGYAVTLLSDGNSSVMINVGKTRQLKPAVAPQNALRKKLAWTSGDERIATVDANGNVKGVSAGTCTVTCEAADGCGARLQYEVQVIQPVTKLEATYTELRLKAGEARALAMLVRVTPANASIPDLDWTVKDSSGKAAASDVYTILNKKILFKKEGKYTLTGTTKDGSNKSVRIPVVVAPAEATLCITENSHASWDYLDGDRLRINIQVTNKPNSRTVESFEIYTYAEDFIGRAIYGSTLYRTTSFVSVQAGSTVYSDNIVIPDASRIHTVYCGIHKIVYADGTKVVIPEDDIEYWYWTLD